MKEDKSRNADPTRGGQSHRKLKLKSNSEPEQPETEFDYNYDQEDFFETESGYSKTTDM